MFTFGEVEICMNLFEKVNLSGPISEGEISNRELRVVYLNTNLNFGSQFSVSQLAGSEKLLRTTGVAMFFTERTFVTGTGRAVLYEIHEVRELLDGEIWGRLC